MRPNATRCMASGWETPKNGMPSMTLSQRMRWRTCSVICRTRCHAWNLSIRFRIFTTLPLRATSLRCSTLLSLTSPPSMPTLSLYLLRARVRWTFSFRLPLMLLTRRSVTSLPRRWCVMWLRSTLRMCLMRNTIFSLISSNIFWRALTMPVVASMQNITRLVPLRRWWLGCW